MADKEASNTFWEEGMRYALIALAVLAGLAVVIVAIGMMLPVQHRAGRQATYERSPGDVFSVINTPSDFPSWRTGVTKVELLPERDGKAHYRETGKDGSIEYEVERSVPGRSLVTQIADRSLPFGGTWTYTLEPSGDRTTLRIVEDGEVYNPIFRFVSRFIIGHHATIDGFLRDLGKKLGQENVVIVDSV